MVQCYRLVKKMLESNDLFPKILQWHRIGSGASIENCINSKDAFRTIKQFSSATQLDLDQILAFTEFLLSIIPEVSEPKAIADYTIDFDGVYDFQFIIDDLIAVLKNKKPTSKPLHDSKQKEYVPEYKNTKVSYIFGLEYNPKKHLCRLRYKIYPQKSLWGFRFDPRHKDLTEVLTFMTSDLIRYYRECQEDLDIIEDMKAEEAKAEENSEEALEGAPEDIAV